MGKIYIIMIFVKHFDRSIMAGLRLTTEELRAEMYGSWYDHYFPGQTISLLQPALLCLTGCIQHSVRLVPVSILHWRS